MDPSTSRRNFISLALGAPLAGAALAACGSSGPSTGGTKASSGGGAKGSATFWTLSGQPQEGIRKQAVTAFDGTGNGTVNISTFANDDYKTKIKAAIGAGKQPTILWGWGGGGLKDWVDAGAVEDLTSFFDQNAALKDQIFPSAFGAATINDKIYAMPVETVTPILFMYNKKVLDKVGVKPPTTWAEVMDIVPKIKAKGYAPFSLAGASRWTNMMWLEFLFDRIGGSDVFGAVFKGEKDAWSNPASIKALTAVQDLVKAGGFQKNFMSTVADKNADQALLFTGKAAMMVHGAWTYASMKTQGGSFVTGGHLGYANFPAVDGGAGDPSDTVGNPAQYLSISSKATDAEKEVAKKFLATAPNSAAQQKAWVQSGSVPVIKGSNSQFTGSKDADFLNFIYNTASNAKNFAQSWDQALPSATAEILLQNIVKLFQLKITPQQWVDNMNKTIGS